VAGCGVQEVREDVYIREDVHHHGDNLGQNRERSDAPLTFNNIV
jgi:hypothetical protein